MYYIAHIHDIAANIDRRKREWLIFDTAMWMAKERAAKPPADCTIVGAVIVVVQKERGEKAAIRGMARQTEFGSVFYYVQPCHQCAGLGIDWCGDRCSHCAGTGRVEMP